MLFVEKWKKKRKLFAADEMVESQFFRMKVEESVWYGVHWRIMMIFERNKKLKKNNNNKKLNKINGTGVI